MDFLGFSTMFWRLPTFAVKAIIGSIRLDFSVRNGKRYYPYDKSPKHKTKHSIIIYIFRLNNKRL